MIQDICGLLSAAEIVIIITLVTDIRNLTKRVKKLEEDLNKK